MVFHEWQPESESNSMGDIVAITPEVSSPLVSNDSVIFGVSFSCCFCCFCCFSSAESNCLKVGTAELHPPWIAWLVVAALQCVCVCVRTSPNHPTGLGRHGALRLCCRTLLGLNAHLPDTAGYVTTCSSNMTPWCISRDRCMRDRLIDRHIDS